MGCVVGAGSNSESSCAATCRAAKGCSFTFKGQDFEMCGDCAQRWLNPNTLIPEILPGNLPFWPPGFSLPSCTSCGSVEDECVLGCHLFFNPSDNPTPPSPTPNPPAPLPPAPWPNAIDGFNFSAVFSSNAVLQASPSAASVYGNVGSMDANALITVTVTPVLPPGTPYTVPATIDGAGRWRALLHPTPATSPAATFTITATCASCAGSPTSTLSNIIFGDVWFLFGQSNAWLQLQFTYARNSSFAHIAKGNYDNIRVASGDSQTQGLSPSTPPLHPWREIRDAASLPSDNTDSLDQFSAPAYHFAEALTDQFIAAGKTPPTLGLIGMAIGGSMIEEWLSYEGAIDCFGFTPDANDNHNHNLWDVNARPFFNMSIKGFLFYQGENNAGALHGNFQNKAGYGCMISNLVASYRAAWSKTPGTTDPDAPFGTVTLSTDDSEGAADMGSFRWSQSANYGVAPNPALPGKMFLAHAHDLADVWLNCGDHPQTKQCPGCDTADPENSCLTPFYMGPGIHPRLKKPVGQRLAAGALVTAYGFPGPLTGPTISGCKVDTTTSTLTIAFNATLLAGSSLILLPYNSSARGSGLSILINANASIPNSGKWVAVDFKASSDGVSVIADLTSLNHAIPMAVKYAWGSTGGIPNDQDVVCCASPSSTNECVPGLCPIFVTQPLAPYSGLPANPFLALITSDGVCQCPSPQTCEEIL